MIGVDISGDKITLRASPKPAVYRLLHESGTLERVGTLAAYLKTVVRTLAGGEVPHQRAAVGDPCTRPHSAATSRIRLRALVIAAARCGYSGAPGNESRTLTRRCA
jgi:hypothetical protein